MRIEIGLVGDGTNIEVTLWEMLGDSEVKKDSYFSSSHLIEVCTRMLEGWHLACEVFFYALEEQLAPPVIAGQFAHLHPYWEGRRKRRETREKNRAAAEQQPG